MTDALRTPEQKTFALMVIRAPKPTEEREKVVAMTPKQPEPSFNMPPPLIGCFKGKDNDCL